MNVKSKPDFARELHFYAASNGHESFGVGGFSKNRDITQGLKRLLRARAAVIFDAATEGNVGPNRRFQAGRMNQKS